MTDEIPKSYYVIKGTDEGGQTWITGMGTSEGMTTEDMGTAYLLAQALGANNVVMGQLVPGEEVILLNEAKQAADKILESLGCVPRKR